MTIYYSIGRTVTKETRDEHREKDKILIREVLKAWLCARLGESFLDAKGTSQSFTKMAERG